MPFKIVVITDPGIKNEKGYQPYDDGLQADIFLKDKNGNVFIGQVWPGTTAFPDFMNPKAFEYWETEVGCTSHLFTSIHLLTVRWTVFLHISYLM